MKNLAIAIEVGSPRSTINLVRKTFETLKQNIGKCDWMVFLSIGLKIKPELRKFVFDWVKTNNKYFRIFEEAEVSWAKFINGAIDISGDYEYFIKSHDDIELLTPDFFKSAISRIEKTGKALGWISFTDIGWQRGDFGPSVRPGCLIDCRNSDNWSKGQIFQFHKFPPYWYLNNFLIDKGYLFFSKIARGFGINGLPYPKDIRKIKKYELDMPVAPVKCHAPFNHFVMIQRCSLDMIGKCEDWNTPNALYVDEDWGLRALQLNLPNIWIPDICYFHFRGNQRPGGTRSLYDIGKNRERVDALFYAKWGFCSDPTDMEIVEIREKYADTLIPWSSYRNSYEWDYEI
jgi:hypothetical protein